MRLRQDRSFGLFARRLLQVHALTLSQDSEHISGRTAEAGPVPPSPSSTIRNQPGFPQHYCTKGLNSWSVDAGYNYFMWSYCVQGHDYGRDLPPRLAGRISPAYRKLLVEHHRECLTKRACPDCGEQVISVCQSCFAPIRLNSECGKPAYCFSCSKPFPWTLAAIGAQSAQQPERTETPPLHPDSNVKQASRAKRLFDKAAKALPVFLKPTREAAIDYAAKTTAEIINKSVGL